MLWHCLRFSPTALSANDSLSLLATRMMRFTSAVSLDPPDGLLLETGASLRYFGGIDALEHRLREMLADIEPDPARNQGHAQGQVAMASAPTPRAASLLAAWRDGARCSEPADLPASLGPLPVRLLASAAGQIDALESAGLYRIASLLALPRGGLARRFGPALLDELDEALGRRPDPRPRHTPAPCFEQRLELQAHINSAPPLQRAAALLVERLCHWLQAGKLGARRFELAIGHDEFADTIIAPGLAEPTWQASRLNTVLKERLAATTLPAPATRLCLRCSEIDAVRLSSGSLFPDPLSLAEAIAPLLERLQARLGHDRLHGLQTVSDHRPESAWQVAPIDLARLRQGLDQASRTPRHRISPHQAGLAPQTQTQTQVPADCVPGLPRPLWLLEFPQPLVELQGRPFRDGPLSLLAGPERIESGWWDEPAVQRDYFVAEDPAHRLLWIYRERLHRDAAGGWFLHGCFG